MKVGKEKRFFSGQISAAVEHQVVSRRAAEITLYSVRATFLHRPGLRGLIPASL